MIDVTDRLATLTPSEATLAGYLFWLSRPRFWFYLAGPVVVGVVYGASTVGEFFAPVSVALFLYFLVPANVFLYGVNDIFDADIDRLNPKKAEEGREVRYAGGRGVVTAVFVSTGLGLLLVPVLPAPAVAALAAFFVLGTAYSAPPVRFKTTPILDSVSNGLYIMPGLVAFAALSGGLPPLVAVAGGWLWTMGMHTFSAIPDIEPDRAAGIRTTATFLGGSRTMLYCGGCWLAAAVLMGLLHPFLGAVFLVYPVFLAGVTVTGLDVSRAYWWFPALNTLAGTAITLGGIWVVLYG